MEGRLGDVEFLNGLTIIAAFCAKKNELARQKINFRQGELNLIGKMGIAFDKPAQLLVDFLVETKALLHIKAP